MKRIDYERIAATMVADDDPEDCQFPNYTDKDIFISGFTNGIEYFQKKLQEAGIKIPEELSLE